MCTVPTAFATAPERAEIAPRPHRRRKVLAVVPAHNEGANLPELLETFRHPSIRKVVDVLIVDDASQDGTSRMLASMAGVKYVRLPVNLGIGGAVKTGLLYALRHGYTHAVQIDGDGQHPPGGIALLLEQMSRENADVVIGSRFIEKTQGFQSTTARRVGIALLRSLCHILTGHRIWDVTSGYRVFGERALEFIAPIYPHDYPEPETVVLLLRNGFRVLEMPAEMRTRITGRSSIRTVGSIYYMAKVAWAMVVAAVAPLK